MSASNKIISCANIVPIKPKTVMAKFSQNGVIGTVMFNQVSPYESTRVDFDISGLNKEAREFHIHEFPYPAQVKNKQSGCARVQTGRHFNPFGIEYQNSPTPTTGTDDQYEIGDFNGKFGFLDEKLTLNASFTDFNLPLYGRNSIVGRSIDIHKKDGSRWVCANIDYCGKAVTTARAQFVYPVIGEIVLRQDEMDPLAETSVYVDLMHTTHEETANHNFHIHVDRVGSDFDADTGRCKNVLGHFNPYSVDLEGDYATQCNPDNQLRCEVGDLSKKHGKISISRFGQRLKSFFTDWQLPLAGPNSVVGRSITVHDPESGAGRLACANVLQEIQVNATATISVDSVAGFVQFTQDSIFSDTSVMVNLLF